MKKNDILSYILAGIILVVGGYIVIRLVKWLLGLLVAGTSILLVLLIITISKHLFTSY